MITRRISLTSSAIALAAALGAAGPALAAAAPDPQGPPTHANSAQAFDQYPATIDSGSWDAGHIQGIAVDEKNGYVYHSFTNMLVKTDLAGNVIGTVEGFTGHLGDLDFNEKDGRVYGSLEYKAEKSFYIAIFDVDKITEAGMDAEESGIVTAVYLRKSSRTSPPTWTQTASLTGTPPPPPTTATAPAGSTASPSARRSAAETASSS